MKKIFAVIVAGILACASLCALAGCGGSSSNYAGKWVCVAVETGGSTIEIADYEELLGMTGEDFASLELKSDGTVSFIMFGEDMTASTDVQIGWEESENGVNLVEKESGTVGFELTYDKSSGRLAMEYEGEAIYFEKK